MGQQCRFYKKWAFYVIFVNTWTKTNNKLTNELILIIFRLLGLSGLFICLIGFLHYLRAIWAYKYLTCEMGLSCPFTYILGACYINSFILGFKMTRMFSDPLVAHLHGSLGLEWVLYVYLRVNSIKDLVSFCRRTPIKCSIIACSYNMSLLEGERGFV